MIQKIADALDVLRIVPRALMGLYIYMIVSTQTWFFALEDPSASQAAFASAVIGAGAAWFGLYVNSGKGKGDVVKK